MRLHVSPMIRSPLMTELDPRTNADNDAALSMKWSHTRPFGSFSKFSSISNGPIASTSKMSLNRACTYIHQEGPYKTHFAMTVTLT